MMTKTRDYIKTTLMYCTIETLSTAFLNLAVSHQKRQQIYHWKPSVNYAAN